MEYLQLKTGSPERPSDWVRLSVKAQRWNYRLLNGRTRRWENRTGQGPCQGLGIKEKLPVLPLPIQEYRPEENNLTFVHMDLTGCNTRKRLKLSRHRLL